MDYFTGNLEDDCLLLYHFLDYELSGSKTGTDRRLMYKKGHGKTQPKGSYSITIGHTSRPRIKENKYRVPSKLYDTLYETMIYSEKPYIIEYLREFGRHHFPDYSFTDVQVNYNWQSPRHKDKGNYGESVIIGLGDYHQGNLVVECPYGDEEVDIRHKPYKFDGAKHYHYTKFYTGDRMSVVFYNVKERTKK